MFRLIKFIFNATLVAFTHARYYYSTHYTTVYKLQEKLQIKIECGSDFERKMTSLSLYDTIIPPSICLYT